MRPSQIIAVATGAVAVVGALGYYLFERSAEQPDFTVLRSDGPLQLRRYGAMLAAETVQPGNRDEAINAGFNRLAAYIFAKERGGEKIAMTAPVMQDRAEKVAMTAPVMQDWAEGGWRTRFVMPSKYTRETLPPPPSDVTISEVPGRTMAAVRFNGRAGDRQLREKEATLREWLAREGLEASGPAEFAFYNSPFIPPLLRRSEVLIPIAEA